MPARRRSPLAFTCRRSTEESTIAHRAADGAFLAEHMPGLERLADFEPDAAVLDDAADGKAEFALRLEPFRLEAIAGAIEIGEHAHGNPARRNAAA